MRTIKAEIYMAHDGTKFFTSVECHNYEAKRLEEAKKRARWIRTRFCDFIYNRNIGAKDKMIHEIDEFTIIGNFSIYCSKENGRVVITNLKTGRSGKAVCSNPKYFDDKTGVAVAWARYLGMEIPDYI